MAVRRGSFQRCASVAALVCLLSASAGFAQKRGMQPADYYREAVVNQVAVSPSAGMVAFTVTTVIEKENRRHREIWLARLHDGALDGAPVRFTDPTQDSSDPRWSPDGVVLSFVSHRGKDPNGIWFASVGSPGGEGRHIAGVEGPPVWSRDGRWIAYAKAPARPADEEQDKRAGWIAPNAISHTLDPKRFDGRVITSIEYKHDGTLELLPDASTRPKVQLFVVPAGGGTTRQLTHAAFDIGGVTWAADSRTILFTGDQGEDDNVVAREPQTAIYAVTADGGSPRKLTTTAGSHVDPALSPDGSRLAYLEAPKRDDEPELMVVDVGPDGSFRGTPLNLTAGWDNIPGTPSWTHDGSAVRFTAGIGGDTHVFEAGLRNRAVRQITQGPRHIASMSAAAGAPVMAYVASDVRHPTEVFAARPDGTGERRLTSFNDALLAGLDLVPAEPLTWKVKDGATIEGWVMKPLGYVPGRKYPVILKIHGGPYGAYGTGWFDQFQMLSASGFFVLFTNPRGSTGYGHAFEWATRGRWGEVDREDYLGGVDAALAKYPDIDPRRVGISGGSYGGFMTNWLTATAPDRWAAAVTARSISNWESWYGSSDLQWLTEDAFFGPPWTQRERYRRLSPMSHVEHVKAPTLILLGDNDYRTPISDNEQWFTALKRLGIPTELVRYPRSSHGLSRTGEPWLLVDRLERMRSWFVYWLIERPAATSSSSRR